MAGVLFKNCIEKHPGMIAKDDLDAIVQKLLDIALVDSFSVKPFFATLLTTVCKSKSPANIQLVLEYLKEKFVLGANVTSDVKIVILIFFLLPFKFLNAYRISETPNKIHFAISYPLLQRSATGSIICLSLHYCRAVQFKKIISYFWHVTSRHL